MVHCRQGVGRAPLIAIGSADVLFAVDSIPAIFGLTQETYLVFAANAFSLLGLRQLFFLLDGLLDRLVATGCPPITRYALDFGPLTVEGDPGGVGYGPRRTVLDALLVEAAAEAGVEVRQGFGVDGVLTEDGREDGEPVLAIDQLGAGAGSLVVLTSEGGAVREVVGSKQTPLRWMVLGMCD